MSQSLRKSTTKPTPDNSAIQPRSKFSIYGGTSSLSSSSNDIFKDSRSERGNKDEVTLTLNTDINNDKRDNYRRVKSPTKKIETAVTLDTPPPPSPLSLSSSSHSQQSTTNTNSSTPNLQTKLTTLALQIEDKDQTISLLTSKISANEYAYERVENEITEKFAEEYRVDSTRLKNELEGRLGQCTELTTIKKGLTTDILALQASLKAAEESIKNSVTKIQSTGQTKLHKLHNEWLDGQSKRQSDFLSVKSKEIKAYTVKSLEPDVQMIVDTHSSNLKELRFDFDGRKGAFVKGYNCRWEVMKGERVGEFNAGIDRMLKEVVDKGNLSLENLYRAHKKALSELKNKLDNENDKIRNYNADEIHKLTQRSYSEVAALRENTSKRIANLTARMEEVKSGFGGGVNRMLNELDDVSFSDKELWLKRLKQTLLNESSLKVDGWKEELKTWRDAEIERLLRAGQVDESKVTQGLKNKFVNDSEDLKRKHSQAVHIVNLKKQQWTMKIDSVNLKSSKSRQSVVTNERTILALSTYLEELEGTVLDVVSRTQDKEVWVKDEFTKFTTKAEADEGKLRLDNVASFDKIEAKKKEISRINSNHRLSVKEIERTHNEVLNEKEKRIKSTIQKIDTKTNLLFDGIENERERLNTAVMLRNEYVAEREKEEAFMNLENIGRGGGGGGGVMFG